MITINQSNTRAQVFEIPEPNIDPATTRPQQYGTGNSKELKLSTIFEKLFYTSVVEPKPLSRSRNTHY